jgi:hypothetical protein
MFQNVRGLQLCAWKQDLQVFVTQNLPLDLKSQNDLIDAIVTAADGRYAL